MKELFVRIALIWETIGRKTTQEALRYLLSMRCRYIEKSSDNFALGSQ